MKQFKTPEPHEPSERAAAFYDDVSSSNELDYLYGRWQDEKMYEDIKDYQPRFDTIADEFGVKIVKMNMRPFGFNFVADGRTYKFLVTARSTGFKRIA